MADASSITEAEIDSVWPSEQGARFGPPLRHGRPARPTVRRRPRLWTTFACAWLLVLGTTAVAVLREPLSIERITTALGCLVVLAMLYLSLTLRAAPIEGAVQGEARPVLSRRARWIAIGAMTLPIAALIVLVPDGGMWWNAMFVIVAAGLALSLTEAAWATATLVAMALVASALTGTVDLRLLVLLAIGGAAMAVRHLTVTIEELRVAREALAHRAVDEERLRIARDLHDLLGHSLSLISIKGELARRLLPDAPDAALREVQEIERAARGALRQVRTTINGYRQPTLRGELAGARELLSAAGIQASIVHDGADVGAGIDGLLAWTVREAVTNVIRHSRAAHCEIHVVRSHDAVHATVTDDGIGMMESTAADRDGGSGLAGLHERARVVGGRLTLGPTPLGGFRVCVDIPLDGATRADRLPGAEQ